MIATASVIDVNEADFATAVLQRSASVPVVVDFWAAWCGPCRTLGPILERLAAEMQGAFVLAKVDVDRNQRLAAQFGVQGIPAVKAFRDGKLIDQFEGALPESRVRAWLKRVVPSETDRLIAAAAEREQSDPQAAVELYRQALSAEPESGPARLGLGRVLTLQADPEGRAVLQQIRAGAPEHATAQALLPLADLLDADAPDAADSPAPSDSSGRWQQAARHARAGAWAEALQLLLAIVQRDRAFGDDAARRAMLAIFTLLGAGDPLVVRYRQQLASALF
jgi:putative thioredoxin